MSWAAQAQPAREDAKRITNAAERAGLAHLVAPARLAASGTVTLTALAGVWGFSQGNPLTWLIMGPLLAPLVVGASLFYSTRKLLNCTGQVMGMASTSKQLALMSKTGLGAVLLLESTVALVLLGLHQVVVSVSDAALANQVVTISAASLGLSIFIFARASVSAAVCAELASQDASQAPHPGSLALLVNSIFHSPLLQLLTLAAVSLVGHVGLLLLGSTHKGDSSLNVELFSHQLKLLGLFALLLSVLLVRTSDREKGSSAWLRSFAVFVLLMVCGVWSMGQSLPATWSIRIPVALTLFFLALGVTLSQLQVARWSPLPEGHSVSVSRGALARAPAIVGGAVLVLALVLFASLPVSSPTLSPQTLLQLLLSATFTLVPLALLWSLIELLALGARQNTSLANGLPVEQDTSEILPAPRSVEAMPYLGFVLTISLLTLLSNTTPLAPTLVIFLIGLGGIIGTMLIASTVGFSERASDAGVTAARALVKKYTTSALHNTAVDFAGIILLCQEAGQRFGRRTLGLSLLSTLLSLCVLLFSGSAAFQALALGLSLGSLLLGCGALLLTCTSGDMSRRAPASLFFIQGLVQLLWLLTIRTTL